MTAHIMIPCPNCRSNLRVGPAYIGHRVNCKRCAHLFRVEVDDASRARGESGTNGAKPASSEDLGKKFLAKLMSRNEKYAALKPLFKQSQDRCSQLAGLVQALRGELDRVREQSELDPSLCRALEQIPAGHDNLDSWIGELQGRSAAAERQGEERDAVRAENGRLRAELEGRVAEALDHAARLAEELEAAGAERARLHAQVEELERSLAGAAERLEAAGAEVARAAMQVRHTGEAERRERAARELTESARRQSDREREVIQGDLERLRQELERLQRDREAERLQAQQLLATLPLGLQAEMQRWQELTESARRQSDREREVIQGDLERLRQELDVLGSERETSLHLLESLTQQREQLTAVRDELTASFHAAEQASQAQFTAALQQSAQEKEAAQQRGDELAGHVRELRAELERLRHDREDERRQSVQLMDALQQDLKAQQQKWQEHVDDRRGDEGREFPQENLDRLEQEISAMRREREATLELIESLTREAEQMKAYREGLDASCREAEKGHQAKVDQLGLALQQAQDERDALRRRGDELTGHVSELRAELERHQHDREDERRQSLQLITTLQQGAVPRPEATTERGPADGSGDGPAPVDPSQSRSLDSFCFVHDAEAMASTAMDVPDADPRTQLAIVHRDAALDELASTSKSPRG